MQTGHIDLSIARRFVLLSALEPFVVEIGDVQRVGVPEHLVKRDYCAMSAGPPPLAWSAALHGERLVVWWLVDGKTELSVSMEPRAYDEPVSGFAERLFRLAEETLEPSPAPISLPSADTLPDERLKRLVDVLERG